MKDCSCCGVFVSATEWKEFLCHNLGANTSLDPNVLVQGIHGNYYQWGRSIVVANASTPSGSIGGWNTTDADIESWLDATKTAQDPCPAGYRVPTIAQWTGVMDVNNNTRIFTGTFTDSATNFGSGVSFGPNASTKTLTLPATGYRGPYDSQLYFRGDYIVYWSISRNYVNGRILLSEFHNGNYLMGPSGISVVGDLPIRCIAE